MKIVIVKINNNRQIWKIKIGKMINSKIINNSNKNKKINNNCSSKNNQKMMDGLLLKKNDTNIL